MGTRWERGYRCWGLWENGRRIAFIGIPPFDASPARWSIDGTDIDGEAPSVRVAKRVVKEVLAEERTRKATHE